MTAICPKCHRQIPIADVNVATDVALCRACNLVHFTRRTAIVASLFLGKAMLHAADYFPPPDSVGGWHVTKGAAQISEPAGMDLPRLERD